MIRVPPTSRTSSKITIDGHTKLDLNPEDYLVFKKSPFSVPCNLPYKMFFSRAMEQGEPGLDLEYAAIQAAEVEQPYCTEALQKAGGDRSQALKIYRQH